MKTILYNPLANNWKAVLDQTASDFPEAACLDVTKTDLFSVVANASAEDELYLIGGDGTLNCFVNACDPDTAKCSIYLVRGGTGNDFLQDADPQGKQSYFLLNDYIRDLPWIIVNGSSRRYLNGVACGIDGMVCEVGDDLKAKGKKRINYTLVAVKLLIHGYVCPDVRVTVDNETAELKKSWLASAMKGRYYGGGMQIAPMQDRLSSKLTFVCAHGTSRLYTLVSFPKIFKGKHAEDKKMMYFRYGDDITVEFSRPTAMQIDGEVVRGVTTYRAVTASRMRELQKAEALV